jgi:glutathione S-transferase
MIDLHHCVSARSFRPLWLLEELGIPYRLHMLPFPPRVHARDYLARNPLGTVPLLEDGATRLTESAAMCHYLATRYGAGVLDVAPADAAYGSYLNWLFMSDATLTFPQTLVLRYSYFERFTAADVAVTYALHLAQHLELAAQFPPAVADYWQRMQARPAFQRALQAQHQAALDQAVDPTPSPDLRPA